MDGNTILVKTPKGVEEMEQRTFGLPQRLRQILIMVDGKKDCDTLAGMTVSPGLDEMLAQLINDGFVATASPVTAAPETAAANEVPTDPQEKFKLAKSFIINTSNNILGPFGSGIVEKANKAKTGDELKQLIPDWSDALASEAGKKRAEEMKARLMALL